MTEPSSQIEKPEDGRRYHPQLLKKGLRCDLDQYEMLKCCAGKQDMTEWNQWREKNPGTEVLLEGAKLRRAYLKGANFKRAYLKGANFELSNLEGSFFHKAHLQHATLKNAHLEDVVLWRADLRSTKVKTAIGNGFTSFWECEIDHHTDFAGTCLDSSRIDPASRQLLEYNIRRKNWEQWYQWKDWYEHKPKKGRGKFSQIFLENTVGRFWWVTNYGISAPRIIKVFAVSAVAFAVVYYLWGLIEPPGIVDCLFEDANGCQIGWGLAFVRAVHFSVVIMTVGFTNMHASAHSFWAHILVGFQMILGFVLLGALVTRFAVLFAAGGPAGRFADVKGQKTDDGRQDNKTFA